MLSCSTMLSSSRSKTSIRTGISDTYWPYRGSPDSRRFVMHQEGCQVHVFDAATGESLAKLPGGVFHDGAYSRFPDSIAWHPDGTRFAVVGQFGDIRVWSAETYHLLQRFDGFSMNDLGGWLMHASADVLHEAMRECDLQ